MIRALPLLLLLLLGCSRTQLAPAEETNDAGAERDAGPPLPGRDAGPPGEAACEVGMTFEITAADRPLRLPTVARTTDPREAMLVLTSDEPDGPFVWALPMTSNGNPQRDRQLIGPGEGGTLIGYTLGWAEDGFTLAYRDREERFAGARIAPLADSILTAPSFMTTTSLRPLLVLTEALNVNGWEAEGESSGFVQRLSTRDSVDLTFPGRGMHGALGATPERFRVASHDGITTGFVEERDAMGTVLSSETIELGARMFPVATGGIRIDDAEPSAVMLWGGTVRALFDGLVAARVRGAEADWFYAEQLLHHADAAFDPETGWLGISAGLSGGVDGGGTDERAVRFLGLHTSGATVDVELARVPGGTFEPFHPAILETGPAQPTFLIVWEENVGGAGMIRGGHVRCSGVDP